MLCGFGGYVWERLDLQSVPDGNRGNRQAGFACAVGEKQKVIVASQVGRQVYRILSSESFETNPRGPGVSQPYRADAGNPPR